MQKKDSKMYGRKSSWGRKSLMEQGEKEKLKISIRLRTYGTNLTFVDKALSFGENNRDLPLSIMRQIQSDASRKFNIQTDRSAWRTKTGIKAWFCEYWNDIKEFVEEEVSQINPDSLKIYEGQGNVIFKNLMLNPDISTNFSERNSESPTKDSLLSEALRVKENIRPIEESDILHYMSMDYLLNDKVTMPTQVCFC